MELNISNQTFHLSTTLRVAYEMMKTKGYKTFQETLTSLQHIADIDSQLDLIYTAYKCNKQNEKFLDREEFIDMLLDEIGVFKITEIANSIVEGLLYSGLSAEEIKLKNEQIQEAMKQSTAGTNSSNMQVD